jgi:hypothetical protein
VREYKRIDLKSEADFKKAERLHAQGWSVILSGADYILMERQKRGKACYYNRTWERFEYETVILQVINANFTGKEKQKFLNVVKNGG